MKTKNLLAWTALLLGAAILTGSFYAFKGETPNNVFTLNLCVSLLIYALCFTDVLLPWTNWKDKSHSRLGGIGIRWLTTLCYAIPAVAVMILCNLTLETSFALQLIIQGILLVMLLLGMSAMCHLTDKVAAVHDREKELFRGTQHMRQAMHHLMNAVQNHTDLSPDLLQRIALLNEELRYLSPSLTDESIRLEQEFTAVVEEAAATCRNCRLNENYLTEAVTKAEILCKDRKKQYSN